MNCKREIGKDNITKNHSIINKGPTKSKPLLLASGLISIHHSIF